MTAFRLLLASLVALLAFAAQAATVAGRSVFYQGHWWDSTRSGSGLEIFHSAGEAMVIWYTYERDGKPVWYTAQGPLATLGQNWTLMRHQWRDGRKAPARDVGAIRLTRLGEEAMRMDFTVEGTAGTWNLSPLLLSGVVNEVDHSGSYFDPANSGWGITLTHQGDVLGAVIYAYDAAGEPTWLAGFERGTRAIRMHTYRGACPSCLHSSSAATLLGTLDFTLESEAALQLRGTLPVALASGLRLDGARVSQLGRPASSRVADRTLASFSSSQLLRDYLAEGIRNVRYGSGGVDFSPAPPSATAPSFSGTNLIEAGVDESDLVKSDGRFVYAFASDSLENARAAFRIAEVHGDGTGLTTLGEVSLNPHSTTALEQRGLILHGDRLVAITGGAPWITRWAPVSFTSWSSASASHVEIFDVANRATPSRLLRVQVDGTVLAARRIDNRVYIVTRFVPQVPSTVAWSARDAYFAAAPLSDLLPKSRVNGAEPAPMVDAASVYVGPLGTQKPLADMVVVTEIDLAAARIVKSMALTGVAEAIYVSPLTLYVATGRQPLRSPNGYVYPVEPSAYLTDVHQVRLAATGMSVGASGTVEGFLGVDFDRGGFRMSEHAGKLRIITSTRTGWWGPDNGNRLTILEPSTRAERLLRTVSYIPNAARPERIGKPNEALYGVRFVGERAYAVTFLRTDPLYVLDLANPHDPRVAAALEVPGFSDYLHPVGSNLLLGFGKDAEPAGSFGDANFAWFTGLQMSLYDVSDAGKPREIKRLKFGKRGSESALLESHHALSAITRADGTLSLAIPARIHDGTPQYYGGTVPSPYPFHQSVVLRIEMRGTSPANADIVESTPLVFKTADYGGPYRDPGARDGRSIQFRNGTVFIGNGKFWRQDAAGTTGPQ